MTLGFTINRLKRHQTCNGFCRGCHVTFATHVSVIGRRLAHICRTTTRPRVSRVASCGCIGTENRIPRPRSTGSKMYTRCEKVTAVYLYHNIILYYIKIYNVLIYICAVYK